MNNMVTKAKLEISLKYISLAIGQYTILCAKTQVSAPGPLDPIANFVRVRRENRWISNSYTVVCPPVRGDNARAIARGLSPV